MNDFWTGPADRPAAWPGHNRSIGSPALSKLLGIDELRTRRLQGFALTFWHFERADHIEVLRLVGQRQDQEMCRIEQSEIRNGFIADLAMRRA